MATDFAAGGGGGGPKRRRVDDLEGPREGALAETIPVDRISVLPDELRQRILTHLSLKEATCTGVLARGWRDLWKNRWPHRSSVEIHLRSRDGLQREIDVLAQEPRPLRRLDRFSLIVDICKLRSTELRRFLNYAAECRVEDLHVEMRKRTVAEKLNFHLPLSSPLLTRLSLRRINISNMYYKGAEPFHALEVIRLHAVCIAVATFRKMIALCPNLRTLDLRGCDCDCLFYIGNSLVSPAHLRSVTVAECAGQTRLDAVAVPSLRSFRYSGGFLEAPFRLPSDAALTDLYICFSYSISRSRHSDRFNKALPNDLSGLTVLTICSNALPAVFPLSDGGTSTRLPKLSNLHNLRELQLIMLNMVAANLADIYVFFNTCQCANLERLFVHLPESNYKPIEASLDDVGQELPEVYLENLKTVKVLNFNWRCTEVQLVGFLLRKATSLHKLLLISPNLALLDMPSGQEADQLLLKEALASGKIILCKSDDAATQPYHSETFIEV